MKVILKENVASLGYKDDVVEVKDGYGRNYLIPQGLAIVASKAALKQLAENQRQRAHKIAKILEDAQAAAAALEGVKVTITAKTSASGKSSVPWVPLRFPRLLQSSVMRSTARSSTSRILSRQ